MSAESWLELTDGVSGVCLSHVDGSGSEITLSSSTDLAILRHLLAT